MTDNTKTPDATPEPTIRDLCRQWEIVQAKCNLDLLQDDDGDDGADRIIDAAREQSRAIEETILARDPDDLHDVDLVFMLRLARKVIGDDQFTNEQEARCEAMLDLIDLTLILRTRPKEWDRVQDEAEAERQEAQS